MRGASPQPQPEPESRAGAGRTRSAICPLCGPTVVRLLPFRYRFLGRDLHGVSCATCSLVFVHPVPTDAEIAHMYQEEYFTQCTDSCGAHGTMPYLELAEAGAEERKAAARRMDRRVVRRLGGRGALCEVGCGPGYFLAEMRDLGWRVKGLEISEYAAARARESLGLEVVVAPVTAEAFAAGELDAVFMGDVLEHLPRPLEALGAVRTWLREGAILAVAVPSTLNLLSARIGMALYKGSGRTKTLRLPPYHLVEYTPPTLRRVLVAAGFEVLELRQGTVPLRRMGLRGNAVENAGKVSLQILAHLTSRVLNRGGDRLLALARRPAVSSG